MIWDIVRKEQGKEFLKGPCNFFYIYYTPKYIFIFINKVVKSWIPKADILEIVNNAMLNCLELLIARILRALYLTPLNFLIAYKFKLKINKELVEKQKLIYNLS